MPLSVWSQGASMLVLKGGIATPAESNTKNYRRVHSDKRKRLRHACRLFVAAYTHCPFTESAQMDHRRIMAVFAFFTPRKQLLSLTGQLLQRPSKVKHLLNAAQSLRKVRQP